jgi:hypothetical protein
VRVKLVLSLASALFKSYLRSGRGVKISFFSQPGVMFVLDSVVFVILFTLFQYIAKILPSTMLPMVAPLIIKTLIGLPVLMTSAIIVAGLMFELGQGSAVSSSEAVNWLPISPREFVAASALSTTSLYSAFLAIVAGATLPLVLKLELFGLWPITMLLSLLSLLMGSFLVEILRAAMNRVSSTVYKKSGRIGMISRLVALILLFSVIQIAFQPYFLYWALGLIVGGIEAVWLIPVVWPSYALVSLTNLNITQAIIFLLLSIIFTLFVYEVATQLRYRYWSPIPVSITVDESFEYVPSSTTRIGFNSLETALAQKEFRALIRRKDMARFMAIPVVMIISFMVPMITSPIEFKGRAPGFFLSAFIPYIVPLMFSTIGIGQEGNSLINLFSLPIKPTELMRGKLTPSWVISGTVTILVILGMEYLAPIGFPDVLASIVVALMAIVINSYIGLGVGSRWPDYTIGARSRYVTMKGFLIGFILAGLATIFVFTPVAIHIVTSGGVLGQAPGSGYDLFSMITLSVLIGGALIFVSYHFCKKGIENLLSNS